MTKKEQIYIDYLIAKLLGERVTTVAEKHGCTRDWVYQVVRECPTTKDTYSLVQKYIQGKTTKRDKEIQVALIRKLHKEGKSVVQIAKYTGKSTNNVHVILYG